MHTIAIITMSLLLTFAGSTSLSSPKMGNMTHHAASAREKQCTAEQIQQGLERFDRMQGCQDRTIAGRAYVDLGLSVVWATCNLGASGPGDYGDYYAWGGTKPKSDYFWETYRFRLRGDSDGTVEFKRYNTADSRGLIDSRSRLESADDAAHADWGGSWRMPTRAEWDELLTRCTWTWTVRYNRHGYLVTSQLNGNSIFLPAAGLMDGPTINHSGIAGGYWASNLDPEYPEQAVSLSLYTQSVDNFARRFGLSIRPVSDAPVSRALPSRQHLDGFRIEDYTDVEIVEETVEEETIPFQLVEEKPSFNGGDANEFSKWVNSQLVYPEIAKENGVQGRVTLQFTVEADGRVTNVKVLRGVDDSLDKEAVRVVSSSPRWKPGKQRDRAVKVTYTFPVIFGLK